MAIVAAPLMFVGIGGPACAQNQSDAICQPIGDVIRLRGLPEASGLTVSLTEPGRLWAHNDSGEPEIFAIDASGLTLGRVRVAGAEVEDWEAIASARCGNAACLYVADIGDNHASRDEVVVYRVPEPARPDGAAEVNAVFRALYPDGPHDAETLLAAPDGRLFIVTKGETSGVAVYRFPRDLDVAEPMRLERVGEPLARERPDGDARITDGAFSPNGRWVVLRTHRTLTVYRTGDFLEGRWQPAHRIDLSGLREPQGEGVSLGPDGTVYLVGEAGVGRGGTFAVLSCPVLR